MLCLPGRALSQSLILNSEENKIYFKIRIFHLFLCSKEFTSKIPRIYPALESCSAPAPAPAPAFPSPAPEGALLPALILHPGLMALGNRRVS